MHPLTGPTTRYCNFFALIALFNNDQVVLRNCFYVSFLLLLLLLLLLLSFWVGGERWLFIYLFIYLFIHLFIYSIFLKFHFEII